MMTSVIRGATQAGSMDNHIMIKNEKAEQEKRSKTEVVFK
jgi:hypothetical protein